LEKAQALIAAENERKTEELEKARRLQLSMLPKEIPKLPHIEIDAYMKTATEVGGDYYDFQIGNDGALTVVIGDATEHGLNAGMIVTATKSILTTLSHETDPVKIFKHLNETLKRMNLSRHYMALQMIRIKDSLLEVCSAGMPPLLLYHAVQQQVEEISLKAMPLGSVHAFPYQRREVALSPGDAILLMSDGFPELFDPQGEIFDYERVQGHLQKLLVNHQAGLSSIWCAWEKHGQAEGRRKMI
jgi:serine phosphatase RsbU (regulator of sigma subunit)